MDHTGYLFAAFAVTWVALSGYLIFLHRRIRDLEDRLRDRSAGEE